MSLNNITDPGARQTVIRIVKDNSKLLNQHFFEIFSYGENIDGASKAAEITSDQHTYLYLAFTDGALAGYALAYRFPALFNKGNMAYLYDIEVLQQYRNQRIGTALIETAKKDLLADKVDELWLGTDVGNEPAMALYRSTGAIRSDETFYDFTYKLADLT